MTSEPAVRTGSEDMTEPSGCDLCGDFPVTLHARCHPTAPLRVEMPSPTEVVFYCYLPECNREVTRLRLATPEPRDG